MTIGKEVLILKSRISELKQRCRDNDRRADNYIRTIREIIDPLSVIDDDFTALEMDKALMAVTDLHTLWEKQKELKLQISKIEKELNV